MLLVLVVRRFVVPNFERAFAARQAAIEGGPTAIRHLPEARLSEPLCLAAVQEDGQLLKAVPETLRSEAVCAAAVRQDGLALAHVPPSLMTEEMCLAAVRQNGRGLGEVPQAMRSPDAAVIAKAGQESSELGAVTLRQRVAPLAEMLRASLAENKDVTWHPKHH